MSPTAKRGSRAARVSPATSKRKPPDRKVVPTVKKGAQAPRTPTPIRKGASVTERKTNARPASAPRSSVRKSRTDTMNAAKRPPMKKAKEPKKTRPHAEKPAATRVSKSKDSARGRAEAQKKPRESAKTVAEKQPVRTEPGRRKIARREVPPAIHPAADQEQPHFEAESEVFVPDEGLIPEALPEAQDELLVPEDIELDPLEIPLELLDPDLVDVPRPQTPPRPKPKPARSERRMQQCAACGGMFQWVSVERLCFSCLKRKLSQRKREDESYSGYPSEPEEESDN